MGLNWGTALSNLGTGLINTGQRAIDAQERENADIRRSDLAVSQAGRIAELQQKIEQDKQARIAEIVGGVQRGEGETDQQYQRHIGEALTSKGLINEGKGYLDRADRYEDRADMRDIKERELGMRERELSARLSERADALNIKKEDRKNLDTAIDKYARLASFRAQLSPDTSPEDVRRIDGDLAAAGARLMEFGIKVPSATDRASQIKVVKGDVGEGDTVIRDNGRGGVERVDPKALPVMGGSGGAGGKQEVRVNGKVIGYASTQAEADELFKQYRSSK